MDIKQIIQHQDTLIALSASGRLYRLEVRNDKTHAIDLNVSIAPDEIDMRGINPLSQEEVSALLADQA